MICFRLMENKPKMASEKSYKKEKCSLVACELDLRLPPQFNMDFVMWPRTSRYLALVCFPNMRRRFTGTHNLPDITCFYTLICDDDVAFESISALICPSRGVKEPRCKRQPNKWTCSHIIQHWQWNEKSSAKGCTSGYRAHFQIKPLLFEKKNPLLFLRRITIKSNKRCLMTYYFFKASKSGRKPGHLEKRDPRLSQYMHLSKGPLPWKYLQLHCYPAPSHSPSGEQGQSTAVGSLAAAEQCFFQGKILLCCL